MAVDAQTITDKRYTGQIKWFNNKSGFGFITCSDEDLTGKDVFVHFSAIRLPDTQYKYLVQGEYVEFNLAKSDNDKHEFNAADVYGIKGGAIMCEMRTRNVPAERKPRDSSSPQRRPRPFVKRGQDGERSTADGQGSNDGFAKVERKKKA
jgi:cold shock CspA family protein